MIRVISDTVWTADRINTLIRLVEDGQSYRAISIEIGLSRNSVMSKAKRLGISTKHPNAVRVVAVNTNNAQYNKRERTKPMPRLQWPTGGWAIDSKMLQQMDSAPLPDHAKEFMDLTSGDCRYPYGKDNFKFCGLPAKPNSSYCECHHTACWVPAPRPKQR